MSDHLVLCVDRLIAPELLQPLQEKETLVSCSHSDDGPSTAAIDIKEVGEYGADDEAEPLIQSVECRICQEEDSIKNLEIPCVCSGSLKVFSGPFGLVVAFTVR